MRTTRFTIRSGSDLGRTIAEARFIRGITQTELADETQIDRTYLARLESGHTVMHLERALYLLKTLGVTVTATLDINDG